MILDAGAALLTAFPLFLAPPVLDHDTAVEEFLAAVAEAIDDRAKANVKEVRARLSPKMFEALDEKRIESVLKTVRAPGDVRWSRVKREAEGARVEYTYLCEQDGTAHAMVVTIDGEDRVSGWWVKPGPALRPRAEIVADIEGWKGDWGIDVVLLDAGGAELDRFARSEGREAFPLGSTFKIYVLAELARQVTAGELSLDAEVPIRSDARSLPSGKMHELPDGELVAVRRMAEQMIAISDNTATDHLIDLVGRENIEAHLGEYFNSLPERNTPFLTTWEMFAIKTCDKEIRKKAFGSSKLKDLAADWPELSPEERRSGLETLHAGQGERTEELRNVALHGYGLSSMSTPGHLEIEWFARPADIVALVSAAHRGELVDPKTSKTFLEIYARGEAIYPMPNVVRHGFKGGSETGVFALSTLVVLDDGRAVVGFVGRSGVSALDATVPTGTMARFTELMRNLAEGDPAKER